MRKAEAKLEKMAIPEEALIYYLWQVHSAERPLMWWKRQLAAGAQFKFKIQNPKLPTVHLCSSAAAN